MTETTLSALPHPGDQDTSPFDLPPHLAQWQEEEPVRRISVAGGRTAWLVTRHEDVRAALADSRLSSDRDRPGYPLPSADEPPTPPGTFIHHDPPHHTDLRRMLNKTFMPKNIERLRPHVKENIDRLLDELAAQPQPANLYRNFALQLPTLTICELLGVPYSDRPVFQRIVERILDLSLPGAEVGAAYEQLYAYIGGLLDAKAAAPADDLVSELAVQRVSTGELSKAEAIGVVMMLLIAGHDTTAGSLSLTISILLRDPALRQQLLAAPERVPAAVEELLRVIPGLHIGLRRVATEDLEIGGVTVRAGEGVVLALNAANHDPRVFDRPDTIDFDRAVGGARNHLAWGHGIHRCLGQALARLQLQIALPALFERFPDLRLAVPFEEIGFREDTLFSCVDHLPVTW